MRKKEEMVKKYIMTPGPTPISEEVLIEHGRSLMHHRSPEFGEIFSEVSEKLKKLYKTKNDVFVLTSSGSGGLEAAITNSFCVGDRVLVASMGNFGERFKKISQEFGLEVVALDYEWGDAVDPQDIKGCADKVATLIQDKKLAAKMGKDAKELVKQKFLITRHLDDYLNLMIDVFNH
jgi:aspartate aminotransferase-like enzyme